MNTTYRSNEPELMDDFSMSGEILTDALDKIDRINQLLGGNQVTINGLKQLLDSKNSKTISILDVGCGNGGMLRELADFALKRKLKFDLTGIDANLSTVQHAQQQSQGYPAIKYICTDIFNEMKQDWNYDVILCTLTLHHFKDQELIALLRFFKKSARIGIVINDLHRSAIAYYLFQAICFLFRLNHMSRLDGLTSILRGFKRKDLEQYSNALKLMDYRIKWKWAFRYQWIIKTYGS